MSLRDEILEQPDAARRLLERGTPVIERIAAAIRARPPRFALIAARGSSDHAALYAQYLFGVRNHLAVALATPSIFTLYAARPRLTDALVLAISQSGRSPDIVAVVEEARRQGAPTIAITNDAASPLAGAAADVVELHAGPERATAATKTYTGQLLVAAMLSLALEPGGTDEQHELRSVPQLMEEALAAEQSVQAVAAGHAERSRGIVLGRGYEYATAREWALKLQELAQLPALPFSAADFEHGPLALIEPGFPILALAPAGPTLDAQLPLLRRLREEHDARLLVVSDSADARELDEGLTLPAAVPSWLSPLISILPGQLYAYHLTRGRGLDPEVPRSISKVTRTR
ncbi:MAG: SIS domain-containing protein [Chloroflexota bacterium]|nr:SIS domain-containing protein [Chloroflexota bacterium]